MKTLIYIVVFALGILLFVLSGKKQPIEAINESEGRCAYCANVYETRKGVQNAPIGVTRYEFCSTECAEKHDIEEKERQQQTFGVL